VNFTKRALLAGRILLSVVALLVALVLAKATIGYSDFAFAYLFPILVAIWFKDRSVARRATAAASGVGVAILMQLSTYVLMLGVALQPDLIAVWFGLLAKMIGAVLTIANILAPYWVAREILRSNPTVERDGPQAARPSP